jgi:hypothetical protein
MQISLDKAVKIYNSLPYQKGESSASISLKRWHTLAHKPLSIKLFPQKPIESSSAYSNSNPPMPSACELKLLPCAALVLFSMQMRVFILQNLLS